MELSGVRQSDGGARKNGKLVADLILFACCGGKRGTHLCACFKLVCFSLVLGAPSMLSCWRMALSCACVLSICERGIKLLAENWVSLR